MKKTIYSIFLICATISSMVFAVAKLNQNSISEFVVKRDLKERKTLYKKDLFTQKVSLLFTTDKTFIQNVQISADNTYISLIETDRDRSDNINSLVILNQDGSLNVRLDENIREYLWCPDQDKIAYISGVYSEEGEPVDFFPTGLYIYDVQMKKKTKIENALMPYVLHWVKTSKENFLYMRTITRDPEKRILRYNVQENKVETTDSKGIMYSPDGKYYVVFSYEAGYIDCDKPSEYGFCTRFFEANTNKQIDGMPSEFLAEPIGWVYNQGHLFMYSKKEYYYAEKTFERGNETFTRKMKQEVKSAKNYVYDVESKKQVQQYDGKVPNPDKWGEWIGNPNLLIVEELDQNRHKHSTNFKNKIIIQKIPAQYREDKN